MTALSRPPEARWWDFTIRLVVVGCVLAWAFFVLRPFLTLVVWGGITSVAVYPIHRRLARLWTWSGHQHPKLAAGFSVVLALVIVAVPIGLLIDTIARDLRALVAAYDAGTLTVPAPPGALERWPWLDRRLGAAWALAHHDLHAAVAQYAPRLDAVREKALSAAASTGWALVKWGFSLIVMGVFLATAAPTEVAIRRLATRLAGESGDMLVTQSRETIRSVARGVVGVAAIQAVLAGLGCWVAGIPSPGLWVVAVFALATAQITPTLVLLPTIVYAFQTASTPVAVAFTIWVISIGLLDNVLKPLWLGRGVDVPMLVVFLGAIGGLLLSGVAGLFVGPVIVVIAFLIGRSWILDPSPSPSSSPNPSPNPSPNSNWDADLSAQG